MDKKDFRLVDETSEPPRQDEDTPPSARRPWYRSLSFLVPAGIVSGMFGLYFAGLIVLLLFFSDRRRDRNVRIGGSLLLLWWLWTWTLPGTSPYVGFGLLVGSAVFLGLAARSADGTARATVAGLAATAAALAALALVPYGVRGPELSEDAALRRTLDTRRGHQDNVDASQADVVPSRERFTNRPFYFVVLHEQNPDRAKTGDGEPCFRRAEVHVVDALDGSVEREANVEAKDEDGNCLPLRLGTGSDLVPVDE